MILFNHDLTASTPNTSNKRRSSLKTVNDIGLTPAKRQSVDIESKVDKAIRDKCIGKYMMHSWIWANSCPFQLVLNQLTSANSLHFYSYS